MIEWHKNASAWVAEIGHVEIKVHHYVGCGDKWFFTLPIARIKAASLESEDIKDAKKEALNIVKNFTKENIIKWKKILLLLEEIYE
jgi:hypothetical protein